MGVKRKGSRKYKKHKSWKTTKNKGIVQTTTYIKDKTPYEFKLKGSGRLQVHARTKQQAVKEAKSWERWLKQTKRGKEKVDFSKPVKKWTKKGWRRLKG